MDSPRNDPRRNKPFASKWENLPRQNVKVTRGRSWWGKDTGVKAKPGWKFITLMSCGFPVVAKVRDPNHVH
jgi:hypothetical protein